MRRFTVVLVSVIATFSGASFLASPPVSADVVQAHPDSRMLGFATIDVYFDEYHSTGSYATHGQLGSGTYRIDATYTLCGPSDNTLSVTGTATFVRSDGARLRGTVSGTADCGSGVTEEGAQLDIDLTSGTRDLVGGHLVLDRFLDDARCCSPTGSAGWEAFTFTGTITSTHRIGYWMVSADGRVSRFGGVRADRAPVCCPADINAPAAGNGYVVFGTDGSFANVGIGTDTAPEPGLPPGDVVVAGALRPNTSSFWMFTNRGRVIRSSNAPGYGDLSRVALHAPIVGAAATPTGKGYWLVASDGGVFAFGDARFRGSMGGTRLNQPVVGMAATRDGSGYWLVASDGGVFAFDAPFRGSLGALHLDQPIVDIARYGAGYVMAGADGGIFDFSSAPFFGSLAGAATAPVVALSATG